MNMENENTEQYNAWACDFRVKDPNTKKWGEWKTEKWIQIELITGCQQDGKDHLSIPEHEQEDLGWMRALRWKHCTERNWGSSMQCRVVLGHLPQYERQIGRRYKLDTEVSSDHIYQSVSG